jgi:hypothetical protein
MAEVSVVATSAVNAVTSSVPMLLPGLSGLGLEQDGDGLQILLDAWLAEMEAKGAPREFCYRVLVGALAVSLGFHAGREAIDGRLLFVLGEGS